MLCFYNDSNRQRKIDSPKSIKTSENLREEEMISEIGGFGIEKSIRNHSFFDGFGPLLRVCLEIDEFCR